MKKKLLIILGAGSSISCGLPSVSDLDLLMDGWSEAWATQNSFPNYYRALGQEARAYYASGKTGLRPTLNFEKVLGEVVALAHWMTPPPWGNTLRQVAAKCAAPPSLQFPYSSDYGPSVTLNDQLRHLMIELARHIRGLSRRLGAVSEPMRKIGVILDRLREDFEVGIYNLNYDTVAAMAWPEAFFGFDEAGRFRAASVHQRSEWSFIYHLHGSVHHSLSGRFADDIEWRGDLSASFEDAHQGSATDERSEGKSFPRTTLIAGGFKLDQLLVEPFHSFHAALVRHVYEADAILVGGYGFGDVHVNRALRNRFTGRQGRDRPPVMVLDYATEDRDPMEFRTDIWAHEFCRTLYASGHTFFEPGHTSPPVPEELKESKGFEVSEPHRVALWHAGFIEAAFRIGDISRWLDGGDDEDLSVI